MADEPEPIVDTAPDPQPSAGDAFVADLQAQDGAGTVPDAGGGAAPATAASVRDFFAARGYQAASDFASDEEFANAFEQSYLTTAQRAEQAQQQAQQYRDNAERWLAFQAEQQAQQAAPPQPAPPDAWKAPEYEERWETACVYKPEIDRYVVKPEYTGMVSQAIADKVTDYKKWEAKAAQRLTRDFPSVLEEQLTPRIQQIESQLMERFENRLKEVRYLDNLQREAVGYIQSRAKDFYQQDAQGQTLIDPTTGQFALSQNGQRFLQFQEDAKAIAQDLGYTDQTLPPGFVLRTAIRLSERAGLAGPTNGHAPPPVPQTPQQVTAAKRQETLNRGRIQQRATGAQPSRRGSMPATTEERAQNPHLSPGEQFLAELNAQAM